MDQSYYVTTPIYYISGNPHIGHAYTTVVADVLARTARTFRPTFFLTGTDEHGQKVANAAAAAGKTPQEWCDELVPRWKALFALYEVSYDDFIRTTEPRHYKAVSALMQAVYDNGWIELGVYEGLYCVSCEAYYSEDELPYSVEAAKAFMQSSLGQQLRSVVIGEGLDRLPPLARVVLAGDDDD